VKIYRIFRNSAVTFLAYEQIKSLVENALFQRFVIYHFHLCFCYLEHFSLSLYSFPIYLMCPFSRNSSSRPFFLFYAQIIQLNIIVTYL